MTITTLAASLSFFSVSSRYSMYGFGFGSMKERALMMPRRRSAFGPALSDSAKALIRPGTAGFVPAGFPWPDCASRFTAVNFTAIAGSFSIASSEAGMV